MSGFLEKKASQTILDPDTRIRELLAQNRLISVHASLKNLHRFILTKPHFLTHFSDQTFVVTDQQNSALEFL